MTEEEFALKIKELKGDDSKLSDELDIISAIYRQFNDLHTDYAEKVRSMHHTWELETRMIDITNISIMGSTDIKTQTFSIDSVAVSGNSENIVHSLSQCIDRIEEDEDDRNRMKMLLFFELLKDKSFRQFMSHHISEIVSKMKE